MVQAPPLPAHFTLIGCTQMVSMSLGTGLDKTLLTNVYNALWGGGWESFLSFTTVSIF